MDELEKKKLEGEPDTLDATSASPETEPVPDLNSDPIPVPETEPVEGEEPVTEPVAEPEPVEPVAEPAPEMQTVEENGVVETDIPEIRTFTQEEVNELIGKTRTETREKTFKYIYNRYGVQSESELDEIAGNAQAFDSLREEYDGAKKSWKENEMARGSELDNLKEQVALMESGIENTRYEDAKAIIKAKGLPVTAENIVNELATHPEWKKNGSAEHPEYTKVADSTVPEAPVAKMSVPPVLGNEQAGGSAESEEDIAMKRLFKL